MTVKIFRKEQEQTKTKTTKTRNPEVFGAKHRRKNMSTKTLRIFST